MFNWIRLEEYVELGCLRLDVGVESGWLVIRGFVGCRFCLSLCLSFFCRWRLYRFLRDLTILIAGSIEL